MKNVKKILIPNPCSENWDEMKINSCGRFCASCEKTVVDFTRMDDAEFVAYFQNNKHIPCGIITERQLSLNIPFRSKPLLRFTKINKYVAASMLAVAGLNGKMYGQSLTTEQSPIDNKNVQKSSTIHIQDSLTISGVILDERNKGIPGASIKIKKFIYRHGDRLLRLF